ncbi:hypothetical protein HYPSUDRAFT_723725, partial [Hypholoma sublateritium FD-334 SS-4]
VLFVRACRISISQEGSFSLSKHCAYFSKQSKEILLCRMSCRGKGWSLISAAYRLARRHAYRCWTLFRRKRQWDWMLK